MAFTQSKISIPVPCNENWNKMTPDESGRFCGSCCKSVIDFSHKTPKEIASILELRKNEKLCGRFKKSQLDEPFKISFNINEIPHNLSYSRKFILAVFLVFGSLLFSCQNEQGKILKDLKLTFEHE